jgi:hypothetical protein
VITRHDSSVYPLRQYDENGTALYDAPGLTKREHFAVLALQAMIPSVQEGIDYTMPDVAADAVRYADTLIAALNATPPGPGA